MSKIEISIILPCHNEGVLVHRTLNSIKKAIEHSKKYLTSIEFEIIASLDNASEETIEYFNNHKDKLIKVFSCNYADLGKNRNFALSKAQGEYIALVDADDLITDNWFTQAYLEAKKLGSSKTLFHPRWTIYFERETFVAEHYGSDEKGFHYSNLVENNYWTALFFAKKSVFDELKYEDSGDGYGYEDWHLYCEALAKGVAIKVIDETAYYIRRKMFGSLLNQHVQNKNTLRPSKLFTKEVYLPLIQREYDTTIDKNAFVKKELRRAKMRELRNALNYKTKGRFGRFFDAISFRLKKSMGLITNNLIDLSRDKFNWMINDWKKKNDIEPKLFPEKHLLSTYNYYKVADNRTGLVYASMLEALPDKLDYLFIVPWIKKGGAEKVLLNYIKSLFSINPNYKIAVITTMKSDSPWKSKLPKDTIFFELGNSSINFEPYQICNLLLRYLVQYPPSRIHVINSEVAYQMVQSYGVVIRKQSKLYASIFTEDYTEEGRKIGLIFDYLPSTIHFFNAIATDNSRIIETMQEIYAFKKGQFYVQHQPIKIANNNSDKQFVYKGQGLNILWAGRIDMQKWPELLLKIADGSSHLAIKFHVWGSSVINEKDNYLKEIKKRKNIQYHGPFNNLKELPIEQYDLFFYTSKYDGIPNVLLEVMSEGLPIISTGNGGVREVIIDKKNGYIINNKKEFLKVIEHIIQNYENLTKIVSNAKKLLEKQHSYENYICELKSFPEYII